jgi:hypothetical protein
VSDQEIAMVEDVAGGVAKMSQSAQALDKQSN